MSARVLLGCAAMLLAAPRAAPLDPQQRSISSSNQFIIFCSDTALRARVTSFVEEVKADVLALLGESDRRGMPIVVTLMAEQMARPGEPPVRLQMFDTPEGPKIEVNVVVGGNPATINLQRQIVRAVLLEYAYRARGGVPGGQRFVEAPWWLVEGALQTFRRRDHGVNADLFRRLIATNKLPPIEQFLRLHPGEAGFTAEAIDAAFAMCLLELLLEQPGGRQNLAQFVRRWPQLSEDPVRALTTGFPTLGEGPAGLQKWWTLNVARFSAADRYQGISADKTNRELEGLLRLEVVVDKAGTKKTFPLGEFEKFVKLPDSRAAAARTQRALIALSTRANALVRPVVSGYEQICASLARGKTRGIKQKMEQIERYRALVLNRIDEIADYLNWMEATKLGTRSDAFESFLRAGEQLSIPQTSHPGPTAQYLDELEQEFAN
ncbi:MAG: hypothetical protein M3463_03565 [Verrucomicrobiota bacterium]|nr:hypothetical protein [Verrucomicrobiota bacterium]